MSRSFLATRLSRPVGPVSRRQPAPFHQRAAASPSVPAASPSPVRLRLLLVEPDPGACTSLTPALSAHYDVEAAGDGLAGWYAAQRLPPALVVIGLSVSAQDRLVFIRALRANAHTAGVPIILLSASQDRKLLLNCLAAGADNFLLQPVAIDELLACARLELRRAASAGPPPGSSPDHA